jgi:hypothetical protein
MKKTNHKPSEALRVKLDELYVAAIRKRFGHVVAIEDRIGVRYTDTKHGAPYERFILENGHTLFSTNWHKGGEPSISISEKRGDPNSFTIKRFLAAKKARAERKAKRAKEAAKKSSAKK